MIDKVFVNPFDDTTMPKNILHEHIKYLQGIQAKYLASIDATNAILKDEDELAKMALETGVMDVNSIKKTLQDWLLSYELSLKANSNQIEKDMVLLKILGG